MASAQFVNIAKLQHTGRAGRDAAGQQPFIQAFSTQIALTGFSFDGIKYRRIIRASHNAHPATNTFVMILHDNAVRSLAVGIRRADFHALRIVAVVA